MLAGQPFQKDHIRIKIGQPEAEAAKSERDQWETLVDEFRDVSPSRDDPLAETAPTGLNVTQFSQAMGEVIYTQSMAPAEPC